MQATSSSFLLTRRTTSVLSNIFVKQSVAGLATGARSVETTTLPNGLKVVSVNTGSPFTTFSVSVRAGSRHEPTNARGVSHIVRNLAFLGTKGHDQVTAARELELVNFEATTTRELTTYTAHFTADGPITPTEYLTKLAKTITAKPEWWRISEAKSRLTANTPNGLDVYLDAAHRAAYRGSGLGNQLIFQNASAISANVENVHKFISESATSGNTVVVAAGGLSHAEVVEAVKNGLGALPQGSAVASAASAYAGGESTYAGVGPAHLVLAVEGAGLGSKDFFATQLLLNILGAGHRGHHTSDISTNQSTLSQNVIGKHSWARFAQAFNLSYSDSGLFGVYAVSDTDTADSLASVVYEQIKNLPKEIDNAETFNRAKRQTLSSLLQSFESNESTARTLTQRVALSNVATGKDLVQEATEGVNGLTQASVKQVASTLVSKPLTLIGGGDVANLPSVRQLRA